MRFGALSTAGYVDVRNAAPTGVFLFSPEVEAALCLYATPRSRTEDWFSHVQAELAAVMACRHSVVELAQRYLKVQEVLWERSRCFVAAKATKHPQIAKDG